MRTQLTTALLTLALSVQALSAQERAISDAEVAEAVRASVALLLENQERYLRDSPVGSLPEDELEAWQAGERERLRVLRAGDEPGEEWPYEGVYRVGRGQIPAGYRVGGSAIVCMALMAAPGFAEDEPRRAAVRRGVELCRALLKDDPSMAPGPKRGYDVRGWGHAYALSLFLRVLDGGLLDEQARPAIEEAVPKLLNCLAVNETDGGGWNYASNSPSPFMTGSTLLALFDASARGHAVDGGLVERALDALEAGRARSGAFAYSGIGEEPMHASCARAAIAELCLLRAGRSDTERLRAAVRGFFDGWEHLLARKSKQGTHEGPYSIAPYYFFFGHTYAALAIEALPEEQRPAWRERMRSVLWRTREGTGSWNDRVFPRSESYGSAMALLALLAPELAAVPSWPPPPATQERELAGWTVHVDRALLEGEDAALGVRAMGALESHLAQIAVLMDAERLAELRRFEIRLDRDDEDLRGMQYHPSRAWLVDHGHSPSLTRKVHIPQARELLSRSLIATQPRVILHELAHAYHDQVLGFDEQRVVAAFEAARDGGAYEEVLHVNGSRVEHYALTNAKEYFAEGTEAYFGANDFYPFVRAELAAHDPGLHSLLAEIWGELP